MFRAYFKLFLERKNREAAYEKIDGYKFTVLPTVFNPVEYISTGIFVKFVKSLGDLTGKYVLDMGCGSGAISIFAASQGAKCMAIDTNPMAVKSALINARQNGFLSQVQGLENELFANLPLPSKAHPGYDIMFFNPPYFKGIPKGNFEKAFKGGENYEVIREFIRESKPYLNPAGIIYFIVSSDMKITQLEQMFRSQGFEFIIMEKIGKLLETFYITKAFLSK